MAKKRKSDAARLEEAGRATHSSFCGAANALSQLYAQAMAHQKIALHAGERHALEKIYQWILDQRDEGSSVAVADIVAYLQTEIDYETEDLSVPPGMQFPQQQPQSSLSCPATNGAAPRTSRTDHTKCPALSNALSSPKSQSPVPFHLVQCGRYNSNGNGSRDQVLDCSRLSQELPSNPGSSNSAMEICIKGTHEP
uniref:Holocarboxylase synthetase n=1 Tax=Ananas comosus var. bracteatus TaxID=296719 RepID=A0A6V7QJJ6_ANACO|nr:unnamed protein product [Ananas comosus var. bracteatus]